MNIHKSNAQYKPGKWNIIVLVKCQKRFHCTVAEI